MVCYNRGTTLWLVHFASWTGVYCLSSKTPAKAPAAKKDAQKATTPDGPAAGLSPEAKREAQMRRKLAAQEAALRRERQQSVRTLGLLIAMFIVVGGGATVFYLREALKP